MVRVLRLAVAGLSLLLVLLLAGPAAMLAAGDGSDAGWRTASRATTGLAPDPAVTPQAVVQVYAARAYGWRGAFGVHSWIAVKPAGAPRYTIYQVIGWRADYGLSTVDTGPGLPDRQWFGSTPRLLAHVEGAAARRAKAGIEAAVAAYPYRHAYRVWPGPNSNTFVAWVARRVPELRVDMPPTAIGKDYLGGARLVAPTASNTGYQISLYGLAGVTLARAEGLEVNLAGLTVGLDPDDLNLKLPGLGRVGPAPAPAR